MARPVANSRPRIEILLETARIQFLSKGFAGTSLDALAVAAGVSKATIYRHYKNKQEILEAVIHASVSATPLRIANKKSSQSVEVVLTRFAKGLIKSVSHEDSIAMFRLIISESHRLPHLGQFFFDEITAIAAVPLGNYLKAQSESGELHIIDSALAAFQFIGMLKEPLFWPLLMGVKKEKIAYSENKVIKSAVIGLMKHYSC